MRHEDWMQDAVRLDLRLELTFPGREGWLVCGLRQNGAASFLWGDDWVWHFNTRWELRRGYDHGTLIKAERGALIGLRRARVDQLVQLVRLATDDESAKRWLPRLESDLLALQQSLRTGTFTLVRAVVPPAPGAAEQGHATSGAFDCDSVRGVGAVLAWLERLPIPIQVANSPHVVAC